MATKVYTGYVMGVQPCSGMILSSVAKVGQINFSKVNFSNRWPVLILVSNSKVVFSKFNFSNSKSTCFNFSSSNS